MQPWFNSIITSINSNKCVQMGLFTNSQNTQVHLIFDILLILVSTNNPMIALKLH